MGANEKHAATYHGREYTPHPKGPAMTTTRAAKYLAPIDLGKTITVTDTDTGQTVTGELLHIDAIDCSPIDLTIIAGKDSGHYLVQHDNEITIAGQPSPPTDNPHGEDQAPRAEQLPAPIPAAQAADAIAHYTVHKDGHIEQNFQIRPRRNGKTTALNAAQAADDADLDIRPGPSCCIGDCCGPGSYCCKHPHNDHDHDDEYDNDHEHIASYQDPEHCVLCGERLEYDENGNRL